MPIQTDLDSNVSIEDNVAHDRRRLSTEDLLKKKSAY